MKNINIISILIISFFMVLSYNPSYSKCTKHYANVHKLWYNPQTQTCHQPTYNVNEKNKVGFYDKNKRIIKYSAFGAGAGYVLSGKKNRATNVLKGAAIG